MKRFHVHVAVDNLTEAVSFYSTLFAVQPSVLKDDYAKWALDDPRINFAISMRGRKPGLDHLGIQVEDQRELHDVYDRLKAANRPVIEQGQTQCCYSESEKAWVDDAAGISWETFLTSGASTVYGDGTGERASDPRIASEQSCCAPQPAKAASCSTSCG